VSWRNVVWDIVGAGSVIVVYFVGLLWVVLGIWVAVWRSNSMIGGDVGGIVGYLVCLV